MLCASVDYAKSNVGYKFLKIVSQVYSFDMKEYFIDNEKLVEYEILTNFIHRILKKLRRKVLAENKSDVLDPNEEKLI